MGITLTKIALTKVSPERETFRISYGPPPDALVHSIQNVGILNPPWLRPLEDEASDYETVLGYSRIRVARLLGTESLLCRIVGEGVSDKELLFQNIHDNASHRELNPVEQSLALKKSLRYFERDKVITQIMPVLGLGSSRQVFERYIGFSDLPSPLLESLASGRIPPMNAISLLRLETGEQLSLHALFETLKIGVNLQKEFIENLYECSRRDDLSIVEILKSPPLPEIINDRQKTEGERAGLFRHELRRLRYPALSSMEISFRDFLKRLSLPPEVNILSPRFFESEIYRLNIRFKNSKELLSHMKKLEESLSSQDAPDWFEENGSKDRK